jgi:hypothetical protein
MQRNFVLRAIAKNYHTDFKNILNDSTEFHALIYAFFTLLLPGISAFHQGMNDCDTAMTRAHYEIFFYEPLITHSLAASAPASSKNLNMAAMETVKAAAGMAKNIRTSEEDSEYDLAGYSEAQVFD